MMNDKIVLITGATNGIGKQTALSLAKMGAQVIITGRNEKSGAEAVIEIKQLSGNSKVDLLLADVSKQADIKTLASHVKEKYARLDVLINNAGLAAAKRQLTGDGIEANFAVNVVAPFLLTHLLLDSLKNSQSARVITLMGGDVPNKLEIDNLQGERNFDGLNSYSHSKLVMMIMMYEFSQRVKTSKVTMNCCYPGQASTNMTRSVTPEMFPKAMRWIFPIFQLMTRPDNGKSAAKASRSSIYLASSIDVEGVTGKYFDPKCKETAMPKIVFDSEVRQNLWEKVHQIAGVSA
ncbi:MAG: SDR family NAD(P)-dependent oxidoreductase [Chloroflexi bacterium]|nr:SDR family NAD(P)-dependent oxidoreductase [Chloroflexota bacterium]